MADDKPTRSRSTGASSASDAETKSGPESYEEALDKGFFGEAPEAEEEGDE
jgi:hypothetical protein